MCLLCCSSTGNSNYQTVPPIDYMATEPEDKDQHIVTLAEPHEEYSVNQVIHQSENEAQGAFESFPIHSTQTTKEPEEHNHTSSPHDDFTASTSLTSPPSTRYQDSTEFNWEKVDANPINAEFVPEIYMDQNHTLHESEPDLLEASKTNVVRSSNHRHYQPMPDTNLEQEEPIPPTQVQPEVTDQSSPTPEKIDGSKHFQPMPDTNLEVENENHTKTETTMTTEGTAMLYDSSNHTTTQELLAAPSTFLPEEKHNVTLEENAGDITEATESDEELRFSHSTQSTSVSTSSNADMLEGSGEAFTVAFTEEAEHLVPLHGASTSETLTESFPVTHLSNTSLSKYSKVCLHDESAVIIHFYL